MSEMRTDAQLVTAYTAGDRGALAGIYDRFSTGLYDTAAAMLRDRHEAADAMQDVFLIAAERMGQLREPERLKPWLYAILRNEVYRRSRKRGRALPTDFSALTGGAEMAAPIAPDAEGEAVSAAELAELVRSAACGLDERDQLVLELSVRQGLQGADLAAALGVSAEQSYTLVHRMRDRVDRSLGALVVARAGRKDCADLADILRGWDGEFTVLIRKRVARHIESCETCERTKKKAAPIALLGVSPAFAAPPSLRDQILAKAGLPGSAPPHAYTFDADGGFPRLVRHLRLPALLLGGALAVLIGVGGGAIIAGADDGSAPPTDSTVTTVAVETTVTTLTPSTTATTEAPTTLAPVPGSVVLSGGLIDLEATRTSRNLDLFNPGGQPIEFVVHGSQAPFTISTLGGTLLPGQHLTFTAALNRTGQPEGDIERTLSVVDSYGAAATIVLRATVENPPVVNLKGPSGKVCFGPTQTVIGSITDESALQTPITLTWAGPTPGTVEMFEYRGTWTGYMVINKPGTYTWSVTATDVRGNSTTVGDTFTAETMYC
ncbi:MAG: sigma-70 family RNA polymerase sigma factor [Actinomycetota bacterium]|nr:sigma-70 family RNA polymerase sigma factor [Actinomycetota bacterium]